MKKEITILVGIGIFAVAMSVIVIAYKMTELQETPSTTIPVYYHEENILSFRNLEEEIKLVSISGLVGDNPTIVTKVNQPYMLTIVNQDISPHTFYIKGLEIQSSTLKQGEIDTINLLSNTTGTFDYFELSQDKPLGQVKVVQELAAPMEQERVHIALTQISENVTSPVVEATPSKNVALSKLGAILNPQSGAVPDYFVIRTTVAFRDTNETTSLVATKGVTGTNPTLIMRTNFPYGLTVVNEGNFPHILHIEGLDVDTKILRPGESDTISLYASKEGVYTYYDRMHLKIPLGQIKAVSLNEGMGTVDISNTIEKLKEIIRASNELPVTPVPKLPGY